MRLLGVMFLADLVFFPRAAWAGDKPPLDGQVPPNLKTAAFGLG